MTVETILVTMTIVVIAAAAMVTVVIIELSVINNSGKK